MSKKDKIANSMGFLTYLSDEDLKPLDLIEIYGCDMITTFLKGIVKSGSFLKKDDKYSIVLNNVYKLIGFMLAVSRYDPEKVTLDKEFINSAYEFLRD